VIRAAQLIPFRGVVENATETERLKQMLAAKLRDRDPFYLTADEFERVLRWKLRRQFERRQDLRQANTDDVIRTITGAALTLKHADPITSSNSGSARCASCAGLPFPSHRLS